MKYKIIKAIDVAGLNFLTPIVLLCYGEEPGVQLRKIFQFIVVPVIAVFLFLGLWSVISEKIQTKSGKLPDPTMTTQATGSIWVLHVREREKEVAYLLEGDERENMVAQVEQELEELAPIEAAAQEKVAKVTAERDALFSEQKAPLQKQLDAKKAASTEARKERIELLKKQAESLDTDPAAREAYLQAYRDHNEQVASDREAANILKAQIGEIDSQDYPALDEAQWELTVVAEKSQHLRKLKDTLSKNNRSVKVENAQASLGDKVQPFKASSDPAEIYKLAGSIVRAEPRIAVTAESQFAINYTLPRQIYRSILCVFTGFIIGSAIAIPLGILCGLSKTFMAAMTPFIAIFKPVSPIIWVIIFLIVVGGFIPDPDKHPLMLVLWDLPLIGWMKINPAFIASALTVSMCSLWATLANTALGVASIEKDHINVARVLKLGFWERLFKIVIPSSLPLIFAGLRISLGVGWMVLIAAELLSSSEGIGKFVWDQFNNGASDSFAKIIVTVFVVGFIGLILDRIMIVFQRLVSFDGAPTAI